MFNRDLANILRIVVKETRAWANFELVEILLQREQDDWTRFAPAVGEEAARPQRRAHRSEAFDGEAGEGGKERRAKAGRGWIGGRMRWRVDSGVAVEDSARCLVLNLCHRQTGVETSLDTARTSACGTMRVSEAKPRTNSKEAGDDCYCRVASRSSFSAIKNVNAAKDE